MTNEAKKLAEALGRRDECGCPTGNSFEQMAVQFGYRASNVNAVAMEQFQLQVAAQNAMLLKMQGDMYLNEGPTNG